MGTQHYTCHPPADEKKSLFSPRLGVLRYNCANATPTHMFRLPFFCFISVNREHEDQIKEGHSVRLV